jgi:hypothetical protein
MGVYEQHSKHYNSLNRDTCPREAFLLDLKQDIMKLMEAGHHIILMLDGNEDMRKGNLAYTLTHALQLREAILQKHGQNAPSTYRRNTKNVPIDGIWVSPRIEIKAGGYFDFDEVISGSDHRTLWIDIDYRTAFGHDGSSPIIKPSARRLNNKNPNIRDNFNALRHEYAENCSLLERIIVLEESIQGEMTADQIKEYEALDQL